MIVGAPSSIDTPLAVVERAYQAWEDRDFVEVLCAFDPEVRWHQEDGLPYGGDYCGRGALAQLVRDVLSDWGWLDVKPRKFAIHHGLVAVVGAYEGEGRVSGFRFEDPFVHVWCVERGRGVWMGLYRTPATALRDLDRESGIAVWQR